MTYTRMNKFTFQNEKKNSIIYSWNLKPVLQKKCTSHKKKLEKTKPKLRIENILARLGIPIYN